MEGEIGSCPKPISNAVALQPMRPTHLLDNLTLPRRPPRPDLAGAGRPAHPSGIRPAHVGCRAGKRGQARRGQVGHAKIL